MADNQEKKKPQSGGAGDNPDFKFLVRIAATDLNGQKKVSVALTGVKGVGDRLSNILVDKAGVDRNTKIGDLPDAEIAKLKTLVEEQIGESIPVWMTNRRKDVSSGADMHLLTTDLDQIGRDDLNRLKKIRSYRGIRHEGGHKVRGQRSRANGRHGLAMGVQKKKEGK